jgi:hypothetical protein
MNFQMYGQNFPSASLAISSNPGTAAIQPGGGNASDQNTKAQVQSINPDSTTKKGRSSLEIRKRGSVEISERATRAALKVAKINKLVSPNHSLRVSSNPQVDNRYS